VSAVRAIANAVTQGGGEWRAGMGEYYGRTNTQDVWIARVGKHMGRSRGRRQLLGRHTLDLAMPVRVDDHTGKLDPASRSTVRIGRERSRQQVGFESAGY
jgi:hypothetical protein